MIGLRHVWRHGDVIGGEGGRTGGFSERERGESKRREREEQKERQRERERAVESLVIK